MRESPRTAEPASSGAPHGPVQGSGAFWASDATMVPRSLRPRAVWAQVAVGLSLVALLAIAVVNGLALFDTQSTIDADPAGGAARLEALDVSIASLERFNDGQATASNVTQIAGWFFLVPLLLVVRWQNVALWNQRPFGVVPRYSPARAFWAWIVPVWFFFGPKRAYNDLWRVAAPDHDADDGIDRWLTRPVPRRFDVWWAAWVTGLALYVVAAASRDDTLGGERTFHALVTAASVVQIGAGILFIAVLRDITDRHEARLQ